MSTPISLITPIPGDPEQVRRVSAQLATVEARAREIASRLRAIEAGVGPQMWRGQAADGFTALLAETGPDLTRLATSYGAASQALATYAIELAAAQDVARAAEAEASIATRDRDRATADRDSAEADAFRHAVTADEARVRLDAVATQDADQRRADAVGRVNAAGAAVDQAERALQAARHKADQAAGERDAAAARCIRELDEASSAGIDVRALAQAPTTSDGPARTTSSESGGFNDIGTATSGVAPPPVVGRPVDDANAALHVVGGSRFEAGLVSAAMVPLVGGLAARSKLRVTTAYNTDGLYGAKTKPVPPDDSVKEEGLEAPGQRGGYRYTLGEPTRPAITFDDDFVFDPNAEASLSDYLSWTEWGAKLHGAPLLRSDLDDALELYAHYRDGTGTPMRVDYEEAYREDEMIRNAVDAEIATAMQWAEQLHRETGQTSFSVSGDAVQPRYYPGTENWQKTLGGHTIWGSGDVRIQGNTVTMEVTIHAEDRYNFNRGEEDIATGVPDEANGRFAELGWAKSFDVSGSLTRTVTWELGSDQPPIMEGGAVDREPGGEDRIDGRGSSQ
jgi:uncharacterized protein YukE